MATHADAPLPVREPLSKGRVLDVAVELADSDGIDAVTMRRLAQGLGVEAMSLYHHVASKSDVLDGMVDLVMSEVNEAVRGLEPVSGWKQGLRARIMAARAVLLRHPWMPGVLETRSAITPPLLEYFDGVAGHMRSAGFTLDLTHHAMHALGSRALGFTQELFDEKSEADPEMVAVMADELADRYPFVTEIATQVVHGDPGSALGWCDDQVEFEFGLDLILDGLDRLHGTG